MSEKFSIIISGIGIWFFLIVFFTGNSPNIYYSVLPFIYIIGWLMIAYKKHIDKNQGHD